MMPDCSFEELIPIFSARYSGDHLWLRPAMKRYGIWRLVHRSHPENSRPMTRSPRNHRITIIYQILHLMYCRTYVNLYDAVRSVRVTNYTNTNFHSTTMASSVLRSAGNGNSNTGATFLYHGTGTFRKSTLGLLRNFLGLMVPCPR